MSGKIIREKPIVLNSIRPNSQTNGHSPLKFFTHGKVTIIDIFKSLASYANDCQNYLHEILQLNQNLITYEKWKEIHEIKDKINRILSIISRDHMKVVFFGRTSNGKSTVINAMLRESILPSGMGHTTNCFLQIEGTEKIEPGILIPGSDVVKNVNNLSSLSNALSVEKLDSDSLVRILWPKDKCRLLRDDVILVDSPGIDVSDNLDQWIEKYCLDADVFILVVSAESTIAGAEKKFFHEVAQRISSPNIFILMNRWDAINDEPDSAKLVRQQHLDRSLEFLCDELQISDRIDANEHRIFFISAREALVSRNNRSRTGFDEGYKERLIEFNKFEHEFEKCLSKSAVQTKFEQHTNRGKEILNELNQTMINIINQTHRMKDEFEEKFKELDQRNHLLEDDILSINNFAQNRIEYVSENVYQRVNRTLNDELKRLYALIEEFDRPFSCEFNEIILYKQELHQWLEDRLNSNLQIRLYPIFNSLFDNIHREMKEYIQRILQYNTSRLSAVNLIHPRTNFTISYRLDCSNLCSNFQEDIHFKYSLGLTTIWKRWIGNPVDIQSTSVLTSKSSLLALGICGLIWRNIGWKAIGIFAGFYGSFYLYEKLMWTKNAQERALKRQYAEYASSKIRLIVDLTSGNVSAQVKQELSRYFAQMMDYVHLEKDDVYDQLFDLNQTIKQLQIYYERGQKLNKQNDKIDTELNQYSKQYLFTDCTN